MGDYGYFDFNSIWCLFYYANKNKRRLHRFAVTKKILIGVIAALGSGLILMVSFVIQIHRGFELGENIRILEHELYLQAASLYTLQNGYSSRYEVLSDLNRVLEFDLAYSNVLYMRELAELERAYHAEIRFLHETLNTLEAQIAAHDENSVHRLEGYAALGTAIPPIAALVAELKTKLAEIDRPFVLHEVIPGMYDLVFVPEQPIDDRLHLLSLELAVRQQELDLLNEYSEQIAPYIDSFPNLHPLSSGMLTSLRYALRPLYAVGECDAQRLGHRCAGRYTHTCKRRRHCNHGTFRGVGGFFHRN